MPFAIAKRPELQLVVSLFWGELDDEVLMAYMENLSETGPFNEPFDVLIVVDEASTLTVRTGLIRNSAKQPPAFYSGTKRVIVAKDDLAFGLGRVYVSESGGPEGNQQIFHELADAANYLGLEIENIQTALAEMKAG